MTSLNQGSGEQFKQTYDAPREYENLDEIAAPEPIEQPGNERADVLEKSSGQFRHNLAANQAPRRNLGDTSKAFPNADTPVYDVPDDYEGLTEVISPSPVQNRNEDGLERRATLESRRSQQSAARVERIEAGEGGLDKVEEDKGSKSQDGQVSRLSTKMYTISYLIFFSFLGTLARLGLQAITFYPGAPSVFGVLWANFAGSLVMGFLSEDRMLFKNEWGVPRYHQRLEAVRKMDAENGGSSGMSVPMIDLAVAKKEYAAVKKTIPLYIGLATGFCGSFTSFSSFIRDVFLALANELPTPLNHPADYRSGTSTSSTVHRNGGYSFMALWAVIIITISVSISGLYIGAHLALFLEPYMPSLPVRFMRRIIDPLAVFLAWGCWLGAVFLAIFPPDRNSSGPEIWRGRAVFALVFAPLGCLGRFYVSLYLNARIPSFPLGTFVVNIFGTAILGMSYDLQHVPLGGVVGCQVLQGVEDGFCGCLTTVSTWVAELTSLRRRHAYRYGVVSVAVALGSLVVIMGSMAWTRGFSAIVCVK